MSTVGKLKPKGTDVLVIEDQLRNVQGQISRLRQDGISVEHVRSGDDAEQHLRTKSVRIMVVDLQIPFGGELRDDGGEQLVQRLRVGEWGEINRATPFIVYTAFPDLADKSEIRSIEGCKTVLIKPEPWLKTVKKHLHIHSAIQNQRRRVLIEFPAGMSRGTKHEVDAIVVGWKPDHIIKIPGSHLRPNILKALNASTNELYASGYGYLNAISGEELGLVDIELIDL